MHRGDNEARRLVIEVLQGAKQFGHDQAVLDVVAGVVAAFLAEVDRFDEESVDDLLQLLGPGEVMLDFFRLHHAELFRHVVG